MPHGSRVNKEIDCHLSQTPFLYLRQSDVTASYAATSTTFKKRRRVFSTTFGPSTGIPVDSLSGISVDYLIQPGGRSLTDSTGKFVACPATMNAGELRSTAALAVVLTIFVVLSRSMVVDAGFLTRLNSTVDDDAQIRNKSSDAERQHYLRGERKAAVITQRLPDMKVYVI